VDKSKLNPLVVKIAEDLMKVRTGLPLSSAIASVNYKMASIATQLHIKVDTRSGYQPAMCNVYSLMLLNSGGGKNSSLGLLDRWYFGDAFNKIRETVYPHYRSQCAKQLEERGIDRELHNWVQSISNATISGMYAYAESYSLIGFGSLNIEVDEIGNAVTSKAELFEQLLTPYDNGDFMPVAKRNDPNGMDISGLPVNLYTFGNKVRLLNGDNTERAFMQLLDEGYGRRFIFIDDNTRPKVQTPQEIMNEMKLSENTRKERFEEREYIASLVNSRNFKRVLELSDDAMYEYAVIKSESDHIVADSKGLLPAVEADLSERHFKTVKLAGIYAFFEGSDTIEKEHMLQAYEVIKESSGVLAKLRRTRPLHDRLLEQMLLEPDKVTAQHLLTYPFINSGHTKKVYESIDLAKQLANERGLDWVEDTHKGVTYYMVADPSVNDVTNVY
jgi:hypothetical protein